VALGHCWKEIAGTPVEAKAAVGSEAKERAPARWREAAVLVSGAALLGIAGVYVVRLVDADRSILASLSAARRGSADATIRYGKRAAAKELHQTDYRFYYGAALETLAAKRPGGDAGGWLTEATAQMEAARERNLAPLSSTSSLALLRIRSGDFAGAEELIRAIEEADPTTYLVALTRARLSLERGEVEAAREQVRLMKAAGAPRPVRREMKALLASAG
jgi:hypothetical protein